MRALPRAAASSVPALFAWACLLFLFACSAPRMTQGRDAAAPVVAADSCAMHAERCNARDDDCDGIIDEDADSSCGLAHAAAACVRGSCVIERCSNGYFNCNGVNSDGCEAKAPCAGCQSPCAQADAADAQAPDAAMPSMSQQTGTPDMPDPSSSSSSTLPGAGTAPPTQAGQGGEQAGSTGETAHAGHSASEGGRGGRAGRSGRPAGAGASGSEPDADGGMNGDAGLSPTAQTDAGSCEPERCDDRDNDCDQKVDEGGACTCASSAPTGQGQECDRCVCDACAEELDNCTGTSDDEWNMLCGDVLHCFGKSVQAGLCTGPDSDCYQNGNGPCAAEFRSAFARGFTCASNPVRVPCGGLTRLRLECYRTKCAAFCKS